MMGLAYVAALLLYIALAGAAMALATRYARKRGHAGWKAAVPVGVVFYLLMFWDHIPTLLVHNHYCATKTGFWIYKTPEEWAKENPGAGASIRPAGPNPMTKDPDGTVRTWINSRFQYVITYERNPFLPVSVSTQSIVDVMTKQPLASLSLASAGYRYQEHAGWKVIKLWVGGDVCGPKGDGISTIERQIAAMTSKPT